jgi:hypothetical protein
MQQAQAHRQRERREKMKPQQDGGWLINWSGRVETNEGRAANTAKESHFVWERELQV